MKRLVIAEGVDREIAQQALPYTFRDVERMVKEGKTRKEIATRVNQSGAEKWIRQRFEAMLKEEAAAVRE